MGISSVYNVSRLEQPITIDGNWNKPLWQNIQAIEISNFMGEIPKFRPTVHEQYFYPFYPAYQPDYRQKVLTAVKWAADNGYSPAFLEECVF